VTARLLGLPVEAATLDLGDSQLPVPRLLVLSAVVGLAGSREEAFRMLGREAAAAGRNHHKREHERAQALRRALGLDES